MSLPHFAGLVPMGDHLVVRVCTQPASGRAARVTWKAPTSKSIHIHGAVLAGVVLSPATLVYDSWSEPLLAGTTVLFDAYRAFDIGAYHALIPVGAVLARIATLAPPIE